MATINSKNESGCCWLSSTIWAYRCLLLRKIVSRGCSGVPKSINGCGAPIDWSLPPRASLEAG